MNTLPEDTSPKAEPKSAVKAAPAKATWKSANGNTRRGTDLKAPPGAPVACREGSKQAMFLDLLAAPEGVTMEELITGLSGGKKPWTGATVRSGFGRDMKQKGYGVRSEFDEQGIERFFVVLPKDKDGSEFATPPHRPLKGKPKREVILSQVTQYLESQFTDLKAPPLYDRPINIQEVEAVLCKWKSHMNGHYPLLNDITEIRDGLVPWMKVSQAARTFNFHMPTGAGNE